MRGAKIIDRADQIHAMLQCQRAPRQRPASARQRRQPLPERRVQPLDIRRVDHAVTLSPTPERLTRAPVCHPRYGVRRRRRAAAHSASRPGRCRRCARDATAGRPPPRVHRITKGLPNGADVGAQAIGTEQQGRGSGAATHALDQPPDQRHVALFADLTGQPQAAS